MSEDRPRTYNVLGNLLKFHAFPGEAEDKYCVVEYRAAPGTGAPPNHHAGEMESFFVIDGTFEFMIDGKTQKAAPGDFITIPDGAVHAFTNIGDRHGRVLIINAPGKIHEAMFTQMGSALADDATDVPPPDGPPDIPRLIEIAARSGVTILPPPG